VGGEGWDYITCITEMQDGGYLAGGYFQSTSVDLENGVVLNNNDGYDGMIIKYDEEGSVEWGKAIGGEDWDYITCIAETRDEGYIVGGYFKSNSIDLGNGVVLNNSGNYDGIIIKYDESGNVEWGKAVGGTYDDRITCITETQDGGYAVGGYFYSTSIDLGNEVVLNNNDNDDGMIIKYDENGNVEWGKEVGGEGWDYITCITEMQDGGYAIGGNFNSYSINLGNGVILNNKSEDDGMIIKYETIEIVNVEIKEQKKLDGNIIEAMIETSDGGNLIGKSDSSNLCMIKYDSAWNVEWEKEIKGRYNDRINCIVETIDGGYIVVGSFYSSSIDLGNGIVLKNKSMYNPAEPLSDGMIIKYSADGKVEWGKVIGGEGWDYITCITETRDGGYVVGGYFKSSSIDLGNEEVLNNSGNYDGIIIKYDESGNVEWGKTVGGSNSDCINCIIETIDGGYIIGGYFKSNSIDLGNGVVLNNNGDGDGIIIKYSSEGKVEWGKAVGGSDNDEVTCITETRDRGYIVGGQFNSDNINLDNGVVLNNNNVNDGGMMIKYSEDGEVEWGKTVGESYSDGIICIAETKDTGYIVGNNNMIIKYNNSGEIEWEKATKSKIISIIETKNEKYKVVYNIEEYNDETDEYEKYGVISEVTAQMGAPEVQELIVKNTRKEFKITTEVKEIEGIKGGTITGEKQKPYETVKYGDNSTKEIIITPDKDYEIIGITINGKEHQFTANEDGTYTLSKFDNVIENKHIVVAFAMKGNKITINKTDKITKQLLPGAKFRIEQIEERSNPENVLGELTENGQIYVKIDETNKVEGAIGELVANSIGTTNVEITNEIIGTLGNLTNNGEYYFAEQDGKYVPNNTGMDDTVANSYMEINLIGKAGNYAIVVNAEASSEENYDYGYATITEDTIAPDGETEEGQFIKISGEQEAQDYTSSILEGGNIYYLHLGYYKDSSGEEGNDKFTINTIDLYGATEERYNFINIDGKYESSNQGKGETISNSYIPIDLRAYIGKYNITVNAEISSEEDADYGYATITEDTIAPGVYDEEGQFIRISGEEKAKNYTTVLQGGQMYYLHLGYYKNERVDEGQDKFTVNSIQITTNDSELYRIEVETNSQGQAITQIPFGKYSITEVQAPEGYRKLEEPIVIEFRADENHEYTIENEKNAKVIVKHHKAIKNADGSYTYTEEQLSESQTLEGKIDENYTSIPHLNLGKYELIKDENGEYIVPENATGKYTQEDIEVIYYYVEKEIPLTVHHYIEGTTQKVLLKDGIKAEDIIRKGKENEEYTTEAISDELLSEQYELVEIPKNANGIFTGEEIIVTYYYKKAKRELELNKYSEDGKTPLEGVKFTITPKEENTESTETSIPTETSTYTTNSQGKIKLELEVGEYEVTEIEVAEGYQLPEEATIKIEITKETEIAKVEITNTKKRGTVITHHYIEGTENKVPKEDGTVVEDE
ncbi:MAG: hypothetical protein HFH36_14575, partial [Lachnospiraceae bacterium]|nr:hypothetical protein [Lachnospiraceae bacterium]